MNVRAYQEHDLDAMVDIWNAVVMEGNVFPQTQCLSVEDAHEFFAAQSYTGVAEDGGTILGLYILHPNNIGRCSHIANASYAVKPGQRGKRIGEKLVRDSMSVGRQLGFRVLQFNAVVASNAGAIRLYNKIGFTQLGVVPGGFRLDNGDYADIILFYISL